MSRVMESGAAVERPLALALWSMFIDKTAAAITTELESHNIPSILLKGPAIARWLYAGEEERRPYADADLLVAPEHWFKAQQLLGSLGFVRELAPLDHPGMASLAGEAWTRGGESVDLHCTIWGMGASPQDVWDALSVETDRLRVGHRTLAILRPPARALLIATHAAKHGDGWAVTDLERGVQQLPAELWLAASQLALDLDAAPTFVAGLRLVAGGEAIVRETGLPDIALPEASLRAWRVPMALGIEQLYQTKGLRAKLGVIRRELFPTADFMRWWSPLARRGKRGLAGAYAWRLLWVTAHAAPAYRAWRQARRPGASSHP